MIGAARSLTVRHTITEDMEFPPSMGLAPQEGSKYEHPGMLITYIPCGNLSSRDIPTPMVLSAVHGEACVALIDKRDTVLALCPEKSDAARRQVGAMCYYSMSKIFRAWCHVWSLSLEKPRRVHDIGRTKCEGMHLHVQKLMYI